MGNKNEKTGAKKKEEVIEIINNLNSITENDLFMRKTKLYIEFNLENGIFQTLFSDKVINAKVVSIYYIILKYSYLDNLKYFNKIVKLDVSQLFDLYNCLRTSLNIFFQNKLKERYSKAKSDEEPPNDICPICDENKVSLMLECYHFFCETCIKTWLFNKTNSCPLCRLMIEVEKDSQEIMKSKQWNVVAQLDPVELNKANETRLNDIINHLFR